MYDPYCDLLFHRAVLQVWGGRIRGGGDMKYNFSLSHTFLICGCEKSDFKVSR